MPGPDTLTLRRFPWLWWRMPWVVGALTPLLVLQVLLLLGATEGAPAWLVALMWGRVLLGLAITFLLYRQPSAPSGLAFAYVLVVFATGLVNIEHDLALVRISGVVMGIAGVQLLWQWAGRSSYARRKPLAGSRA